MPIFDFNSDGNVFNKCGMPKKNENEFTPKELEWNKSLKKKKYELHVI